MTSKTLKTASQASAQRALKVYYGEYPYAYSETKTAILCDKHRSSLFGLNPTAYGSGEYFPAEMCEKCKTVAKLYPTAISHASEDDPQN